MEDKKRIAAPAAKADDLVPVPRHLIGSACSAIDKKRDAPKTLAELRRYTTGDLSRALGAPAVPGESPLDDSELEDLAESACQEALSFGISSDSFLRLAKTVRLRATAAAPQAPAAPRGDRPPLPKPTGSIEVIDHPGGATHGPTYRKADAYTAEDMRAYFDMGRTLTATAPQAPAAPLIDDDGQLSEEVRELITGMTVSVDVSTGEHDASNRLFGEVTEVMEYDHGSDKHKVLLLVQEPTANFKASPALDAVRQALRDYHYALDTRKHGGVAAGNAIHAIEAALGMEWNQGAEAAARAPQAKEGAAP